ncbi:MAG: hypothetical protein FWC50_07480, partial [Planctomycetaceae bacterium]|nr:hypothetical protein [Planctomycetaceae bacterium]
QELKSSYGEPRGFSFAKEIQPILDAHCIECHDNQDKRPDFTRGLASYNPQDKPFSLKNTLMPDDQAKRDWPISYLNLTNAVKNAEKAYMARQTKVVNWINVQDAPSMLPPYHAGAARSDLMKMFDPNLAAGGKTHNDVKLSREELGKIALWIDLLVPACGDYVELNRWNDAEKEKFACYENKKREMHALDVQNNLNYVSFQQKGTSEVEPVKNGNPYRNVALEGTASSNSEYHNMKAFAASNCIDGKTENKGHGDAFPSWGPDQNVNDLWWRVDFGKEILTDQVVIYIRADFPHDTYWKECMLEGSNGFRKAVTLQKTADRQVLTFPSQKLTWLKLTGFAPNFVPAENGWAALSEVEVDGIDAAGLSEKLKVSNKFDR